MSEKSSNISHLLQLWYNTYKRDLPWRNTDNPYLIWISEVILQQTRVAQGYDYFVRFTNRFPDVKSLASASENEVLSLWQGLGYYSRARNLHAAAKMIMNDFDGLFPNNYKDVHSLKGIGDYTAAAIVSFAYNMPYATVDGNVYRVLSRLFGVDTPIDTSKGKKEFDELAAYLLDKDNPAIHNQAMMELGALQCVPSSPKCNDCPLVDCCVAHGTQSVNKYPVKQGKVKTRKRYFNYLDIRCGDQILLSKRGEGDIWQGLYEFPLIEDSHLLSLQEVLKSNKVVEIVGENVILSIKHICDFKHILSHQHLFVRFYRLELSVLDLSNYQLVEKGEIQEYPISRLIEKYMEDRFF